MPIYDDDKTIAEIDIRGRFLMMACDIEWTMLHIMMLCSPDPMSQVRRFNSNEMRMHNKIQCTICDLKKYKPDYYEEYKDELEKLWEFKEVRNDVSHLKLFFEKDTDFKVFKFLQIKDGSNGMEQLFYKPYTIDQLNDYLGKFIDLNMSLLKLVDRLERDRTP